MTGETSREAPGGTARRPAPSWHALSPREVTARLDVDPERGLDEPQARARRLRYGPNRLAAAKRRSVWRVVYDQVASALVVLLLGASVVAAIVGDLLDAVVILAVVVLNAVMGLRQELRAERAMEALRAMLAPRATVRREGRVVQLPAEALVPGDVVLVGAGDRVPADARLLRVEGLEVDESALTGESVPVAKRVERVPEDAPLGDRASMIWMNTVVTRGRGEAMVVATGMATEMGRVARLLQQTEEEPTPLQRELDALGKRLAAVAGLVVLLVFGLGWLRGEPLVQLALTSIALAVAAIPEGLPAVVSVTLALGMHRMAQQRAIVRRMAAVETLGATTVICTDKTGTLTLNQMTARRLWAGGCEARVSGSGYVAEGAIEPLGPPLPSELRRALLEVAVLCNDAVVTDAGELRGDPTEGSLLVLAGKGGVRAEEVRAEAPRLGELPFDSSRKFMVTLHGGADGGARLAVKGAIDVLLERCAKLAAPRGEVPLDEAGRTEVLAQAEAMAAEGLRVLALAERRFERVPSEHDPATLDELARQLTLLGVVGLEDPPRPEAAEAIALCRRAGIRVKMITGDHRATAVAIAERLGLPTEVMEGPRIEAADEATLRAQAQRCAVFARVSPEHKVRLVEALRAEGEVVAMTGDGVNDAPALKRADIGVAMGQSGTEVAKEAADVVLADDNFATIVGAVREGRTIYGNLVKFVTFQVSTNIGAILTVAGAGLLGLPMPLTAVQLLWVNIIMDGPPAMALGLDPPQADAMRSPPRDPRSRILNVRRLGWMLLAGIVMAAGTLWTLHQAVPRWGVVEARTLAFTTFVLFQVWGALDAHLGGEPPWSRYLLTNGRLWGALGTVVLLQALAVHWPWAQRVMGTTSLDVHHWSLALGVAASLGVLAVVRRATGWLRPRSLV